MNWQKRGIIFDPIGKFDWAAHTALQPTPVVLNNKTIRVYIGSRTEDGISRVGWVDLDINDPAVVLGYAQTPALDVGKPGAFDDNGVVPTAVVKRGDEIWMYYAGYQLVKNVRFLVFCGLAISKDGGDTFTRHKNTPVMDRTSDELLFRVIHTIFYEDGVWKAWYGGGDHFITEFGKSLPVYDIRYTESVDGINFPEIGKLLIQNGTNEHRLGRPYVVKKSDGYIMFFGASKISEIYRLAYATSPDGVNWTRDDGELELGFTDGDFDSEMSAYPAVIEVGDKVYLFYNGNEYGMYGIGLAIGTKT